MMKLTEYLNMLANDKEKTLEERILYLYDTANNLYYTKVIHPAHIDYDGGLYEFFDGDEPYHNFDRVNVIRAYTVDNCMTVMMTLESLTDNYGESEVY